MIHHILNGDGLANNFDFPGNIIVCREALIEGNFTAESLDDFWRKRSEFFQKEYRAENYTDKSVSEFSKILAIETTDEVNLWFGDDVFCQLNMWFCVSLIKSKATQIYRIFPDSGEWNCGFTNHRKCFENRFLYSEADVDSVKKLWKAFSSKNVAELLELSKTDSPNFSKLNETCLAIAEIDKTPKEILTNIKSEGISDFSSIFQKFKERAGIYGFGDSQVKRLLDEL
jgi:Domain of unknown function (DUF1835)